MIDDAELMRRIRRGDESALAELYQRYGGAVYSLALRVLTAPALAEEAAQDVFLKVWHQSNQWDADKGRLISWVLTITRYTAIDLLRRERRRLTDSALELDGLAEVLGVGGAMDDPRWHDGNLIRSLVRQLPTEQIEAIELAFFQGMSHTQIAAHLRLPLGTVKTRVRLGLHKLRALWLDATRAGELP